jgi:hypothetical protein
MNRRARFTVPPRVRGAAPVFHVSRTDGWKIAGAKLQCAYRRAHAGDKPARIAFPSCSG